MVNHWWQVTLYVTASGLTTSAMPYQGRYLQIDFDFLAHRLLLRTSDGRTEQFALQPCSVADFYAEVMNRLRALGVDIHIWTMPSEIEGAVPFERDRAHAAYDRDAAQRFWRQLVQADRVMNAFRGRFLGKCSPVWLVFAISVFVLWFSVMGAFAFLGIVVVEMGGTQRMVGSGGDHRGPDRDSDVPLQLAPPATIWAGASADRRNGRLRVPPAALCLDAIGDLGVRTGDAARAVLRPLPGLGGRVRERTRRRTR